MKFIIIFLFIIVLMSNSGCQHDAKFQQAPIPNDIWNIIGPPFDNKDDIAEEKLKELFKDKNKRVDILKYIDNRVSDSKMPLNEAWKLGVIIVQIINTIPEKSFDEHKMVCDIITKSKRHPNFYWIALSVAPPYFIVSIEVFENTQSHIMVQAPNADGGIADLSAQEMYRNRLKGATGQDFGYNYEKWKEWFIKKGQFLEYDQKKMKYKTK